MSKDILARVVSRCIPRSLLFEVSFSHDGQVFVLQAWHQQPMPNQQYQRTEETSYTSSSATAERPRELYQRFQGEGVNLRLDYRLKGYFSRRCDMTHYTLTHHMVIKPFLLISLTAEYRTRRSMRSTLRPTIRCL